MNVPKFTGEAPTGVREWPGIPVWHDHHHAEPDRPTGEINDGLLLPPEYWSYYCESCRGSHTPAYIGCSALRTGETRRCTSVMFGMRCGRELGHLGHHAVFEDADVEVLVSWNYVSRETLRGFHKSVGSKP